MYVAGRKKNATNTSKATTIEQLKSNEFRISDWDYLQFVERIRCQWKSFERARFVERYPNTSVARSREDRVLLFFFFFLLSLEKWLVHHHLRNIRRTKWKIGIAQSKHASFLRGSGTKIAGPAKRRRASVEKEKSPSSSCTRRSTPALLQL